MLVLRLSNKRPISSKKDASSSDSSSMPCPDKGTNEVEGTLTSISSAAEVVVFSAVDCAYELINGNKRWGWQNSPKLINGECQNVGAGDKKWNS